MTNNLGLADGIRKHGFCAWHERALLRSFAWLVVTLLGAIMAFAAFESMLNSSGLTAQAINALMSLAAGFVGILALQRFLYGLARAQRAGSQALCPQCGAFGRLTVIAESRAETWVRVRCRGCEHEWVMDDA